MFDIDHDGDVDATGFGTQATIIEEETEKMKAEAEDQRHSIRVERKPAVDSGADTGGL